VKITVYYDYIEGKLAPVWHVISFRKGDFDWTKETVYVPINAPFQRQQFEDFHPDAFGISVTLSDLTLRSDKPQKFGIYLPPIRRRAVERGYDYWNAEYLIIQVADIEELLQMNVFSKGGLRPWPDPSKNVEKTVGAWW
jgi:hypothetical protein